MISKAAADIMYTQLVAKSKPHDGKFYAAVKTTGVFCRTVCGAKKPKRENTEFFETPKDALLAGYRCCKVCKPLSHKDVVSPAVASIVDAVEAKPELKWKSADFRAVSAAGVAAESSFKRWSGLTYVEYARNRRLGLGFKAVRAGRMPRGLVPGLDVMSQSMGAVGGPNRLDIVWIETPLGPMVAIADTDGLYLLEFTDRRGLETELIKLRKKTKGSVLPGTNPILNHLKVELAAYYEGTKLSFDTPLHYLGSEFQCSIWDALQRIPAGTTKTYGELATLAGRPGAHRAAGTANGANQLSLLVPCHRIVPSDSSAGVGGYGGGSDRKAWLLGHEKAHVPAPAVSAMFAVPTAAAAAPSITGKGKGKNVALDRPEGDAGLTKRRRGLDAKA